LIQLKTNLKMGQFGAKTSSVAALLLCDKRQRSILILQKIWQRSKFIIFLKQSGKHMTKIKCILNNENDENYSSWCC